MKAIAYTFLLIAGGIAGVVIPAVTNPYASMWDSVFFGAGGLVTGAVCCVFVAWLSKEPTLKK